ncbi:ATP-dependent sacrificial sulfur transferase LarE [Actinoplanes sp. NBRC 103695]|uniref:ATP-dependent sacrificial sulfur transferase LarE n=1 Tax=Actinoplanes sp. NBRC 103695 TaxID=3032202 RepID=UPI002554F52C|nr:ATP-dependent sacrificial sulfur transferase LarE [Actinoplanes sp. NBRC 103695]
MLGDIAGYGRTLVAFSGGVDSSVVVAAAARALGRERVIAVTAVSPAVPAAEVEFAGEFCASLGVEHRLLRTDEMAVAGYRENGPTRCYFCKSTLLDTVAELAEHEHFDSIAVGTNASDLAAGFRPGIRAAAERGVRTPLADAGLDKAAVREVARAWSLNTWDKPAAACLSSRIAYGLTITPARLSRVEEAERELRRVLTPHGVRDLRVRDLGDSVRVEVDARLVGQARSDEEVRRTVERAGFGSTPMVVEPFRSGSMNDMLADPDRWRHA